MQRIDSSEMLDQFGNPVWPVHEYAVINPTWKDVLPLMESDREHSRTLAWLRESANVCWPGNSDWN